MDEGPGSVLLVDSRYWSQPDASQNQGIKGKNDKQFTEWLSKEGFEKKKNTDLKTGVQKHVPQRKTEVEILPLSLENEGSLTQEKNPKSQNWVNVGNFLVNSIIPKKIPNLVKSSIPNFSLSWEFEFTKVFPR